VCGLPKARPIICNDCPAFQRHHTSVSCAAESPARFPWVINTTFEEKIYIRWCCIDRLSSQHVSGVTLRYYYFTFRNFGHRVVVAADRREALVALEKDAFDLVLMDVQMPEMGGLEATAAIRKKEQLSGNHQTVIALTAHAMKGDRERCAAAGMDGYLSKPIHPQELDSTWRAT
jgi:CheY-like chemotaxis protein